MNFNDHYNNIVLFNKAGGNTSTPYLESYFWNKMWDQHQRQLEETLETTEAIRWRNTKELLDGIVDEFVVLAGKIYMAECAGFNVDLALSKICKNNLEKVTTDIDTAQKWLNEQSGVRLVESNVDGVTYFSIKRNTDNKIMKHAGFVNVDISDCVPKE